MERAMMTVLIVHRAVVQIGQPERLTNVLPVMLVTRRVVIAPFLLLAVVGRPIQILPLFHLLLLGRQLPAR